MPAKLALPKRSVGAAISVAQAARGIFRRVRKKPTAAEADLLVGLAAQRGPDGLEMGNPK